MKSLVAMLGIAGTAALVFAGTSAVAAPTGQSGVSAKSSLRKCAAKKTAKARKKCRRNVKRQAKLKRQAKNTWWVDYAGIASRHPRRIALSNPDEHGLVVQRLKWKKWGYPKATANGAVITPGTIPGTPDLVYPSKITARKPIRCKARFGTRKGKRIFVYRKVTLSITSPDSGPSPDMDISSVAGAQVCPGPAG